MLGDKNEFLLVKRHKLNLWEEMKATRCCRCCIVNSRRRDEEDISVGRRRLVYNDCEEGNPFSTHLRAESSMRKELPNPTQERTKVTTT